jgi:branched-chain amino acid transport system permease protein
MSVRKGLLYLVGVAAVLALLAHFNTSVGIAPYSIVLTTTVLFWIAQATSWNLLSGFAGYFSFGQGAYVGIGAYSMAVLTGRQDVGFLWSIPVGGLLGGLLAFAVGAVAFRLGSLRGEIFALLTLAVPFLLATYARINMDIDGGQGTIIALPAYPAWVGDAQHMLFHLSLIVATLAVGVALAVHGSRFGHGLAAVHDAEDAAEVLGVPTFRYKMTAIVLGGVLGGMSGAVFAMQIGFVTVESVFGLTIPLFVIVISVLGGRRHWLGPVIGAVFIVVLQDRLSALGLESWENIIMGALLAGLVVVAADGLYERLRARPWLALASFAVVLIGMSVTGYWAELDALLYAMFAAAIVATVADRLRPKLSAPVPAGPDAPEAAWPEMPGAAQPGASAPARVAAPPVAGAPGQGAQALVACEGVTRDFGGVRALDNVSLQVFQSEIVGLVGPNGSGKTTLVNLLCGALKPTRGTIAIGGRAITGLAPHRVAHTGVARTYQIPKPFESMTVRDNVAMAVMFGRTGASLARARSKAEQHLATVHLGHLAGARPDALNLHQRQLLEMARAIAAEPVVLLLDEALAGLNPAEIDDAVAVIRRIHATGISIIVVEHLLRVLNQLSTRIVVLDRGVLIADGAPAQVLSDPAVVRAYLGRQRA